jgi:hypothetical protein
MAHSDEDIPYRSAVPASIIETKDQATVDEANFDTLKAVQQDLHEALTQLDQFHVFDLEDKEGMDIKQQIKAHRLAFEVLAPITAAVDSAVEKVDGKYRRS